MKTYDVEVKGYGGEVIICKLSENLTYDHEEETFSYEGEEIDYSELAGDDDVYHIGGPSNFTIQITDTSNGEIVFYRWFEYDGFWSGTDIRFLEETDHMSCDHCDNPDDCECFKEDIIFTKHITIEDHDVIINTFEKGVFASFTFEADNFDVKKLALKVYQFSVDYYQEDDDGDLLPSGGDVEILRDIYYDGVSFYEKGWDSDTHTNNVDIIPTYLHREKLNKFN